MKGSCERSRVLWNREGLRKPSREKDPPTYSRTALEFRFRHTLRAFEPVAARLNLPCASFIDNDFACADAVAGRCETFEVIGIRSLVIRYILKHHQL